MAEINSFKSSPLIGTNTLIQGGLSISSVITTGAIGYLAYHILDMRTDAEENVKSPDRAASPVDFVATQALMDDEIALNTEKKAVSEKKIREQRIQKVGEHPISKMLIDLISFAPG